MSDPRLKTLKAADPTQIQAAQKRYQHISTTIDDAVTKLQKIVDTGGEGLRGQWVEPLRKDAESLKSSLSKAAVRYHDVAIEIDRYEEELRHAITKVDAATAAEEEWSASLDKANAMPDPQPHPDGTIPPEEQRKADEKKGAQEEADREIEAAKDRLTSALNDLDVAGKSFGDKVNCKNYDDGLTDKINWRVVGIFKWISRIFGIIAIILTGLAVLVPMIAALAVVGPIAAAALPYIAVAGAVATAGLLIADSVLLAGGVGSVLSVVLDVFALVFAGLGAAVVLFGKQIEAFTKLIRGLGNWKFKPVIGPNGEVIPLVTIGSPPATVGAKTGFFDVLKNWFTTLFNGRAFKDLSFLGQLPFFGLANGLKWVFGLFSGIHQVFNLIAGLIIAGMQLSKHPTVEGK
ncbi:hypothetical protein [Plantactinospora sp. KLBMP9567]|uniref:hypothetical protein n=1 Tax=Plantactinospora sp. KLBMP9567 TaxID=3085900 RepID=UPI0029811577|nr:hypothetical protein [Plantactinospora sp. KLBMP9567]MDW5323209.1 hypothetical protein [Plantactinospora sp. KLBMP9567]